MLEEASNARLAGSGRPPLSLGPSAGGRPRRAHRRELERLSLLSGTVCTEAHSCASVASNPTSSKLRSSLLDFAWRCSNFCKIGTRQPGSALNAPRAPTKMIARVEDVLHVTICSSVLRLFVLPCFLHFFGLSNWRTRKMKKEYYTDFSLSYRSLIPSPFFCSAEIFFDLFASKQGRLSSDSCSAALICVFCATRRIRFFVSDLFQK